MSRGIFQTAVPASERPQTNALDRTATGAGREATTEQANRVRGRNAGCLMLKQVVHIVTIVPSFIRISR
jgi:hypothetical protein